MDMRLRGASTVVVGGANGIGKAIAASFAAEGASVALVDVNPGTASVAEALEKEYGVPVIGLTSDVTDLAGIRDCADLISGTFGGVDHVIYAAGVGSGKVGFPFWNVAPADWTRVIDINLIGAVNVAHTFCPTLAAQQSGTVLFIASIAGQIGSQTDPPYTAAKAGLISFSICAARDLASHNVRVNTICPGMIRTDLNRSVWQAWNNQQPDSLKLDYDAWGAAKVKTVAPLGRWQEPDEVGALAVYLASPHACNITGQTLNVDGGQVMHW